MGVFCIEKNNMDRIAPLFNGWDDTMLLSCLQGYMGRAWADDPERPKSARICIGDFCFLSGRPNPELVRHWPEDLRSETMILSPRDAAWARLIEDCYGERAEKSMRYALKKEKSAFDTAKLEKLVSAVTPAYEIRPIDRESYTRILENPWSADLCAQFPDYEWYARLGLGFAAWRDGELLAGASSYAVYREGIEIEIDTRRDHRRRGLAAACGARLILACLARGLHPGWDAANRASLALAEKLGYHFDREYEVYFIGKPE